MRRDTIALLALLPLLAACGGSGNAPVRSAPLPHHPASTAVVRPPVHRPPPPAQVQMIPGLEGVIGAGVDDLVRQFGPARLDVWEGDARKLQFTGTPCVLDVFLYPPAQGRDPRATYVDARRSDGREVDKVACVAALRKP
ncbi:MAG: hypothetical protein KGL44_01225 [Sphingomonadales bacterium]|nr:hypothetical protein [Sphingomonadales bacterium]